MKQAGVEWHGFHSFRRGLATNWYGLGMDEMTIKAIMRHANVETTRRHYIKRDEVLETSQAALRQFEKVFKLGRK
jgi:integrase